MTDTPSTEDFQAAHIEVLKRENAAAQAQIAAQSAELTAINDALGTNEGHSAVKHILALRHDIERHVQIAAELATELEAAEALNGLQAQAIAALRHDIEAAERDLLGVKEYRQKNPLGGPAKVFDAMADRVRAGEDYYAVLRDYGFYTAEQLKAAERDAARYRWLRDCDDAPDNLKALWADYNAPSVSVDAAIDAAIDATKAKEGE